MAEQVSTAQMITIDSINVDAVFNCRGDDITPRNVHELARDIKKNGLLQPVVVGPIEADGKRLLIAGYRRMMAHKVLKRTEIFATVRDDLKDHSKLLVMNLRENVQRVELNLVQEARALGKLFQLGMTEEQVARELNKSRGWVQIRQMVWTLPVEIHPQIAEGTFKTKDVREIYGSMVNDTREVFIEKVKWIKGEKAKGNKKASLKDKQKILDSEAGKKIRSRQEMYQLQSRLQLMLHGSHIGATILAWATAAITQAELEEALKDLCDQEGVDYIK